MEIIVCPFDYYSKFLHDAVNVYSTVWNRKIDDSTAFFRKYARMEDFIGYVALINNEVVGMTFGTISHDGQWWHEKVACAVGRKHPALQDAWVLTELAVLEPYRERNIGSVLHDKVLREQPHPNALLSTQVDNFIARSFYEKRGWTYLHPGFSFHKGCPRYCIMHKAVLHAS